MSLKSQIESILFIAIRPLSLNKIIELTGAKKDEVKKELENLFNEYNDKNKGINIQKNNSNYLMVTNSNNSSIVSEFLKEEITGELTQASLETLTVIAYRGPITKTELELIRGVNCSIILRNLLMRGLIEEKEDKKNMISTYQISFEFMKHLGINEAAQLPDYEKLNNNEALTELLNSQTLENKEKPD